MTTIRNLLLLCSLSATLLGGLTACSDDEMNGYTPSGATIRIVQNDLIFTAEAGSSIVVVDADGTISATTSADWCRAEVSGHTVTVSVESNSSFDGRTALLTISIGEASRQLPIQQQGMVLDLPLTTSAHHSPIGGDSFSVSLRHNLPVTVEATETWIHPEIEGDKLKVTVDSNQGGHIRRGAVVCSCSGITDTLSIAQFDLEADIVGSYYIMGYYGGTGGAPAGTRFDIIQRNDSLLMHWPQEQYADTYIHIPIDRPTCTLFIPSGFILRDDARTTSIAYFYDTEGTLASGSGAGIYAQMFYAGSGDVNYASITFANWPGHAVGGFIVRNISLVTTTLIQLASPVLMRVGPVGTSLSE